MLIKQLKLFDSLFDQIKAKQKQKNTNIDYNKSDQKESLFFLNLNRQVKKIVC